MKSASARASQPGGPAGAVVAAARRPTRVAGTAFRLAPVTQGGRGAAKGAARLEATATAAVAAAVVAAAFCALPLAPITRGGSLRWMVALLQLLVFVTHCRGGRLAATPLPLLCDLSWRFCNAPCQAVPCKRR